MKVCVSEWYNYAYLEGRVIDGIDTRSAHGGDSTSGSNDVSTHFPVFRVGSLCMSGLWVEYGQVCLVEERRGIQKRSRRDDNALCRDISTWQVIPNERAKVEG